MKMSPEMVEAMLAALKDGDAAAALELIESMLVEQAAGESESAEETEALAAPKGDEPPADETMGAPASNADEAEEMAGDVEKMTALSALAELAGTDNPGEIVEQVRAWNASHSAAAERQAILDSASRRALVAELVTLGAETPTTAWADEARKTPVERLRNEPIADMRARVAVLQASAPKAKPKPPGTMTLSVSTGGAGDHPGDVSTLSAQDLADAKARGWSAQEYADRIALAVRG